MIAVALLLAVSLPDASQKLAGPAFEHFAAKSEEICPARALRSVTPGDLDLSEQQFLDKLPRRQRLRVAAAEHGGRRCTSDHGLSCPSVELLDAMARAAELDAFVAYACTPAK